MAIERAGGGGDAVSAAASALRPLSVRRPQLADTHGVPAAGSSRLVFDEAIDIQLGLDRRTGHLAIVGGDVRVEPRAADQPAPGTVAAPSAGRSNTPPLTGSLVNVVA